MWGPKQSGGEPELALAALAAFAMLAVFIGGPVALWLLLT